MRGITTAEQIAHLETRVAALEIQLVRLMSAHEDRLGYESEDGKKPKPPAPRR